MPPINYLAILVAAVAGWLVGTVWYTILGQQWMAASGKTAAEIEAARAARQMPVGPMIVAFIAQLIMAFMLSGLIGHIGPPNVMRGVISGALVWFGFVITTLTVNNAFQMKTPMLTVIDGAHWLVVLVVQGGILGAFG